MSEQFEVGEIAIHNNRASEFYGTEVTVMGPLAPRLFIEHGVLGRAPCYEITCPAMEVIRLRKGYPPFIAEPHELRKRRPPQDWKSLCRLTDTPLEEIA